MILAVALFVSIGHSGVNAAQTGLLLVRHPRVFISTCADQPVAADLHGRSGPDARHADQAICGGRGASFSRLSGAVSDSCFLQNNLNSVERVVAYSDDSVPQEAAHHDDSSKPPPGWPSAGGVEFKQVVMAYRPGLPPVLKGISFSLPGGTKCGIIGRSGAGKSSLMSALFRMVELSSGAIEIDGMDISKIGLSDLRNSLVMIPQDPLVSHALT